MTAKIIEGSSCGLTKLNPWLGEQEKIMMTSINVEGESYDWFLWWAKKCDAHSFYWRKFTTTLLKRFHVEKEEYFYTKFVHLRWKGNVNDYPHESEVLPPILYGFPRVLMITLLRVTCQGGFFLFNFQCFDYILTTMS